MPDERPPPIDSALDDLERRLAAFHQGTTRLVRTIHPSPSQGSETPAPLPVVRPTSRDFAPVSGEASGLRQLPTMDVPQTGALTARERTTRPGTAGFTSAHGRPRIPAPPAVPAPAAPPPPPARPPWRRPLPYAVAAAGVLILAAAGWTVPVCNDGVLAGRCAVASAPIDGAVVALRHPLRSAVHRGDILARIEERFAPTAALAAMRREQAQLPADAEPARRSALEQRIAEEQRRVDALSSAEVACPADGILVQRPVAEGQRVTAGQAIFRVALPGTALLILPLPPAVAEGAASGDRVSAHLLADDLEVDGTVERIIPPGSEDPELGLGAEMHPRAVIAFERHLLAATPGQAARAIWLGRDPGLMTKARAAIRRRLP